MLAPEALVMWKPEPGALGSAEPLGGHAVWAMGHKLPTPCPSIGGRTLTH